MLKGLVDWLTVFDKIQPPGFEFLLSNWTLHHQSIESVSIPLKIIVGQEIIDPIAEAIAYFVSKLPINLIFNFKISKRLFVTVSPQLQDFDEFNQLGIDSSQFLHLLFQSTRIDLLPIQQPRIGNTNGVGRANSTRGDVEWK